MPLRSVTFLAETASPPALRTGPLAGGLIFDPHPPGEAPYRDDGFPFTVGSTSGGLKASQVTASFSVPATGNAVAGQFRHMTVSFTGGGLKAGAGVAFGVDRDQAVPAQGVAPHEGNGADELGGAVFIPQGLAVPKGMVFVGTRVDGSTFTARSRTSSARAGPRWTGTAW